MLSFNHSDVHKLLKPKRSINFFNLGILNSCRSTVQPDMQDTFLCRSTVLLPHPFDTQPNLPMPATFPCPSRRFRPLLLAPAAAPILSRHLTDTTGTRKSPSRSHLLLPAPSTSMLAATVLGDGGSGGPHSRPQCPATRRSAPAVPAPPAARRSPCRPLVGTCSSGASCLADGASRCTQMQRSRHSPVQQPSPYAEPLPTGYLPASMAWRLDWPPHSPRPQCFTGHLPAMWHVDCCALRVRAHSCAMWICSASIIQYLVNVSITCSCPRCLSCASIVSHSVCQLILDTACLTIFNYLSYLTLLRFLLSSWHSN